MKHCDGAKTVAEVVAMDVNLFVAMKPTGFATVFKTKDRSEFCLEHDLLALLKERRR
jgi:hypothetical protein